MRLFLAKKKKPKENKEKIELHHENKNKQTNERTETRFNGIIAQTIYINTLQ